jgi:hypothetical protein
MLPPRYLETYSAPVAMLKSKISIPSFEGCMVRACFRDVINIVPRVDTGQKGVSTSEVLTLLYMSIHLDFGNFKSVDS